MPTGLFDDLVETEEPQSTAGLFDDLVDRDEGTVKGRYFPPEERTGVTYQGEYFPSVFEMEKDRETGRKALSPKGAFEQFQAGLTKGVSGGGAGAFALSQSDDKLKSLLLSERDQMQASDGEPSISEKGANIAGTLLGTGIGAVTTGTVAGRPGLAAFFGAQSAGDAFLKAGLRALAEGKSPEEAVKLARKTAISGAVIGAVEGAIVPTSGFATPRQAATTIGAGGALFGAGQVARNVAERAAGLETPITEGVPQAVALGTALPAGMGLLGRVLRPRQAQPPPIPQAEPSPVPVPTTQTVQEATLSRGTPTGTGPVIDIETIVSPSKPLEPPHLKMIEDGIQRAISENKPPGEAPGLIAGTSLEKWADDVMGAGGGRLSINPIDILGQQIPALAIKGAAVIERGVRDYPAWSAEMTKLYGNEFKPILRKVYMQSLQMKGAATPNAPILRSSETPVQPVRQQTQESTGQVPAQEGSREAGPRSQQPLQPGESGPAQVPLTRQPIEVSPELQTVLDRPVQEIAKDYESIPTSLIASHPSGPTGFSWDLGAKARTSEDVQALKRLAEIQSAKIKSLMSEGNFNEASRLAGLQPAEAYEYATGVNLKGEPKWQTLESLEARRGREYVPPVPDEKYLAAKGKKGGEIPEKEAQKTQEALRVEPIQPASRGIAASAREAIGSGIVPRGTGGFVRLPEGIDQTILGAAGKLAGKSAPRTSAASEQSGNALVRYASSHIAAKPIARWMASEVLGGNVAPEFSERLGAVLVEDRLRAIRQSFEQQGQTKQAGQVGSVIGKDWSPLKTEADFEAALADPAIQHAIELHKATIQPEAQRMHEATEGVVAGPGLRTGAFVNLKAVLEDQPEGTLSGAFRGNLENPRHLKTKFGQKASGTAEQYELDYRTLAERMMEANYSEFTKRQLHQQLVADGLAKTGVPGDSPAIFRGQKGVRFTIERRGGKVEHLWVDPKIAQEYRQAVNTDGAIGSTAITAAANLLNRIQLAGPTDAVWHTANMISSIAGSQGGKSMLADLARKVPGVNIVDAIGRVVAKGKQVVADDPEIQKQLAEIAKIGALRGEDKRGVIHNALLVIDRAGRLVRDDLYQNLVQRGLIENTEAARREWINQMGQYNGRLMGQMERIAKESGLSPFIVAGQNFNRQAIRRLSLSPGVKAAGLREAALMRGVELFGAASTLFLIPATFNFLTTGNVFGRPGTKFGQIDTGKDSGGKHVVIDPAQWVGLRRGLRITGAQSVAEGLREGKPMQEIRNQAIRDVIGGVIHPWAGPAVHAGTTATTGYSPTLWKESKNPKDFGENAVAAAKHLNPLIGALIEGHERPGATPAGSAASSLAGAAGIKQVAPVTAQQRVGNLVRSWMSKSQNPDIRKRYEQLQKQDFGESDYKPLRDALKANDNKAAKAAFQELLKTKKGKDIYDVFRPKASFTGSKALESKFVSSLTPEQLALYRKAKEERQQMWQKFQKAVE